MYKKILVPLDGSEFSECSLAHVRAIATGCHVPEVVLLRVVEPISRQASTVYALMGENSIAEIEKRDQAEVEDYLSQLADKLKKEGIAVQTAVAHGVPADEILNYAQNSQVDLIIMSTHGRSGVSRWAFGSVTDKVLRHSTAAVLTTSPSGCRIG